MQAPVHMQTQTQMEIGITMMSTRMVMAMPMVSCSKEVKITGFKQVPTYHTLEGGGGWGGGGGGALFHGNYNN